jgi:hypothetical protein
MEQEKYGMKGKKSEIYKAILCHFEEYSYLCIAEPTKKQLAINNK